MQNRTAVNLSVAILEELNVTYVWSCPRKINSNQNRLVKKELLEGPRRGNSNGRYIQIGILGCLLTADLKNAER